MAKQSTESTALDLMNDDSALREIKSFSDALDALNAAGIGVKDSAEYGNGFRVIPDKAQLVKVPFVILGARTVEGDQGMFTVMYVVTESGDKYVVTDGSTGIHKQIGAFLHDGIDVRGMLFRDGLTRSDYEYVSEDGSSRPATTYYLSGI